MKLKVLGCSGGIGSNQHTTSFLLDRDILIDVGTGVGGLSLGELGVIDHIFLTHAHLDHIACLPMLVDSVWQARNRPITVYAIEAVIETLKQHIFNWKVWPDFTQIPDTQRPALRYQVIHPGATIVLDGRHITAIPAAHVVPAVGYHLDSGKGSLVFSGDTTSNDALWDVVNRIENLRYLIIECAFADQEKQMAILSKHLCPELLAAELSKMKRHAEVYITHLKPDEPELIMYEIERHLPTSKPGMLLNNQQFEF